MSLQIIPILCNEKNMLNYAYLLHTKQTTLIIDAAEPTPIFQKLAELNLKPSHILTTHHHFDHVGGNLDLKAAYNLKIVAPEKEFSKISSADIKAKEGSPLIIGDLTFQVISAPGHTQGHVLYYLPQEHKLFTGDTLFNLCIGGLFEGTPEQMFQSLQKIKALPDETEIFPGHEYTRSSLSRQNFENPDFELYLKKMLAREKGKYAPATLAEEKRFNPYLQTDTFTEFLG